MYHNCYENRTNHACRFIAIYADFTQLRTVDQEVMFIVMNLIELITHLVVLFVVFLSLGTVRNCARFHPNIVRIFLFFIGHSYVYAASRFVIFFFQNGIVEIEELGKISYTFLMIFSVLRVYHLYSCVFVFTAFCAERCLATIYLDDYENRRNPTASIVILASVVLMSVGLSLDTTYVRRFTWCPEPSDFLRVHTFQWYFEASLLLHKHNLNQINVLSRHIHRYRLSTRFQIVENCRAFELLRNVAIVSTLGIFLTAIGLVYSLYILSEKSWASIAGAVFDTSNAVVFAAVIIMCCFSQPTWRDQFKAKLRMENRCVI
ncbi:hypothetical protein PFISCL1PPCAC_16063, partial [Pristionchus fissidentatus]